MTGADGSVGYYSGHSAALIRDWLKKSSGLIVFDTHPVQYRAPLYRLLEQKFGIPVTVIYGSDFSVVGYFDKEFGKSFAWDTDLLSGYASIFLSRVSQGGADSVEKVSPRGIKESLKQISPKAVMITGYHSFFHQMAFRHAYQKKYPILFRADTADHALKRNLLKNWLRDHALRFLYSRCQRLLYIGQRSLDHFRRLHCPEEKLIFSPYCVDASVFHCKEEERTQLRLVARESLRINQTQKAILFSGKLIPRKGPDLLLKAIKTFPEAVRQEWVLIFMGNGELRRGLEKEAERAPRVEVRFVGFQNQSALSRYYHAADLFILPSRSEVWGVVVNEALHHGLPCVVSEGVGATPDLIEPGVTGEIFKKDSAESLALAIQRALPLGEQPTIRERCREKVEGYTVEKAAHGIARAYQEVVGLHAE